MAKHISEILWAMKKRLTQECMEEDSRSRHLWHIYDKTSTCCADLTRCGVDGVCLNDAVVGYAGCCYSDRLKASAVDLNILKY